MVTALSALLSCGRGWSQYRVFDTYHVFMISSGFFTGTRVIITCLLIDRALK